ncbi:hypothetical protein K435DRAFT_794881 [Dendrothele bispora CBS 962.96]|uniref:Uncharacterized protein n=1 Tax=Dendrothele bispora (strain CBS 962.96) TaxID=1314807 RepID=A0A4S8MAV7_DENBC|nr:hypothetical protein K435DRAFT_794881 [Dendrothele bispora CBS 962.96]
MCIETRLQRVSGVYRVSAAQKKFKTSAALANHRKQSQTCSGVQPKLKPRKDRVSQTWPSEVGGDFAMAPDAPSNSKFAQGEHSAMVIDEPGPSTTANNPPPPPNALRPSRTGRARFLPAQYIDQIPALSHDMPNIFPFLKQTSASPPAPPSNSTPIPPPEPTPAPEHEDESEKTPQMAYFNTEPNEFGVYHSYLQMPQTIPDEQIPFTDICEGPGFPGTLPSKPLSIFGTAVQTLQNTFAPFLNATIFLLMAWFYNGHESKSLADLDNLVKDVIFSDDFQKEDLEGFSAKKVVKEMYEWTGPKSDLRVEDGWVEGSLKYLFQVKVSKKQRQMHQSSKLMVFFIENHLMLYKQSSSLSALKISTISLSNSFNDMNHHLENDSDDHVDIRLHHELYNSDAYIKEYEHIQIQQHERRLKDPKLAEEPEVENVPVGIMAWSDETHLTQFGDQSMWPIYIYFGNQSKYERAKPTSFAAHHLAYIPKLPSDVQDQYREKIGFPASSETLKHLKRELIQAIWSLILDPEFMHAYEHGILVKCGDGIVRRLFPRFFTYSADYPENQAIEVVLQPLSYIPTINTFSNRFYKFGTNFFLMFVPDVLHEIELVQELDARYRQVPSYGRARDFEDMLQISIPVFEGLVPDHNKQILGLLFDLCTFIVLPNFAFILRALFTCLMNGQQSLVYNTKEIPKETAARGRRNAQKSSAEKSKGKRKAVDTEPAHKSFNLSTYKIHALGHYVQFIHLYGTTDNYTTQIGELEHRRVKRFYARTNRTFKFVRQVTALERRKRIIESAKLHRQKLSSTSRVASKHSDQLTVISPKLHYKISEDTSVWTKPYILMNENPRDPAVQDFYLKLREHLYSRLSGKTENITIEERDLIRLKHDRIYSHKVLRINYTTYDMRRSQDCINPRTHADVMVHSSDPEFHIECAFGFIDPNDVVRAVHLIPAFHFGKTKSFMGPSNLGRRQSDNHEDWAKYYVSVFSDRDMFARFVPGFGIGHVTWAKYQRPQEEVIIEEGTSRGEGGEMVIDAENENELMDYGYAESDVDGNDSEDEEVDNDDEVGLEDDEEPANYDMENPEGNPDYCLRLT